MFAKPTYQQEKPTPPSNNPIAALRGLLADGSSLTADLLAERKEELEREELRIAQFCADKRLDETKLQLPPVKPTS